MSKHKIIAQGAEAQIVKENGKIIKDRIPKTYRIRELDRKIRIFRTKSEAKLLEKASDIINSPKPEAVNLIKPRITLPFINGKKLSEHLDKLKNKLEVAKQIGRDISLLHQNNIIHGDLTTSNMILVKKNNAKTKKGIVNNKILSKRGGNPKTYLIDFGLGYISLKIEDKAVDLHLLKQALEAKHYKNYSKLWKSVEAGYKSINKSESKKVLERLIAVEKRGRYKKH